MTCKNNIYTIIDEYLYRNQLLKSYIKDLETVNIRNKSKYDKYKEFSNYEYLKDEIIKTDEIIEKKKLELFEYDNRLFNIDNIVIKYKDINNYNMCKRFISDYEDENKKALNYITNPTISTNINSLNNIIKKNEEKIQKYKLNISEMIIKEEVPKIEELIISNDIIKKE
jgi:hypothetical protein